MRKTAASIFPCPVSSAPLGRGGVGVGPSVTALREFATGGAGAGAGEGVHLEELRKLVPRGEMDHCGPVDIAEMNWHWEAMTDERAARVLDEFGREFALVWDDIPTSIQQVMDRSTSYAGWCTANFLGHALCYRPCGDPCCHWTLPGGSVCCDR